MNFPSEHISLVSDKKSFETLQLAFETTFQNKPNFFVRCPGRVNLIGEHIDYNDFCVLPIAIDQSILVAVGSNDQGVLNIHNIDDENFPSITIAFEDLRDKMNQHTYWYNYIFAGVLGIADNYQVSPSFNMLVSTDLPIACGLSSSSALVCAAALTVAYKCCLHESHGLGKLKLSEICATAEQYVGTRGGGMDQASILLSKKGFANKINFKPLHCKNVHLPEELQFIVANSGIKKEKALSGDFNKRVAECKLAAKILAKQFNLDWTNVNTLGELTVQSKKSPSEFLDVLDRIFKRESYSSTDICSELCISLDQLKKVLKGFKFPNLEIEQFKLLPRARHVFLECLNVVEFINGCKEENLITVGSAMNSSHQSLKDNYECSHEKLDNLVKFALQSGALGARLTGAGWGGCIVAAVTKDRSKEVERALKQYVTANGLDEKNAFLTKPSSGAVVVETVEQNNPIGIEN